MGIRDRLFDSRWKNLAIRLKQQANRLREQGRYEEAIVPATHLHDLIRQKLKENDPDFALSLVNLAELHAQAGNYEDAETLYLEAIVIQQTVLGKMHPDVAKTLNALAMLLIEQQEFTKAEFLLQRVLNIRRVALGEMNRDYALSLSNLAELYIEVGNYEQAEPLQLEALEIRRKILGEQHPEYIESLNSLSIIYYELNKFMLSIQFRKAALGEENPELADYMRTIADVYLYINNYEQAELLYQEALAIYGKVLGKQNPDYAATLNNLAALYDQRMDYRKAEPLYQQAVEICRNVLGEKHPDYARCLHNLAKLYHKMGDYPRARSLYQEILEISRTALGEQHNDYISCLDTLAVIYQDMGDYRLAESHYQEVLRIRRKVLGEKHPDFASSLNNLAGLYVEMGDYLQASLLLSQAVEIRETTSGENNLNYAINLNNLAGVYSLIGDDKQAETLYLKALEIKQAVATKRGVSKAQDTNYAAGLRNLAEFYLGKGDYQKAELFHKQALEIIKEKLGERHPRYAESLSSLAVMYAEMGDYRTAESLYCQTQNIQEAVLGAMHPDYALTLIHLAMLYATTNREAKALTLLQQATAIYDQALGQFFSIGSERQRMAYVVKLKTGFELFLSLILQFFRHSPTQIQSAFDLVIRRKGIVLRALTVQRDALFSGRYPHLAPLLEELKTLQAQIVQKALAGPGSEALEKYEQTLEKWHSRREELEVELAKQIPEMRMTEYLLGANTDRLINTLAGVDALVEFVRFNIFDFQAVPARGETQWKPAHYIAFVLATDDPSQVHLVSLGEADGIDQLIAAFRTSLTGEQVSSIEETLSSEQSSNNHISPASETLMIQERNLLDSAEASQDDWTTNGNALRESVFDPLLPYLGDGKRLFLAPDGDLSRLPFEVLPLDDGRCLIQQYHISYLSTGRDILRFNPPPSRSPATAVVVADPDFDLVEDSASSSKEEEPRERHSRDLDRSLRFGRLRGTHTEGEQVMRLLTEAHLDVQPMLDQQALEKLLKAAGSPRILHLATHGFFLPNQQSDPNKDTALLSSRQGIAPTSSDDPMMQDRLTWLMNQHLENPLLRSGLAMAGANTWNRGGALPAEAEDGMLTAEDVSGMDLLDTELVVLSACETGLGVIQVGEGVFGLRRAFMLAGAKTLVMSLWKVPDKQTQELMKDFYQRLYSGQSRAEALRQAQLAIKERYPHPLYWGAFICQGDPRPLPQT